MAKQWFVTIGVPGGEYAVKAQSTYLAANAFVEKLFALPGDKSDCPLIVPINDECYGRGWYGNITVRPAPPDLVEWIEEGFKQTPTHDWRYRCEGGWIYEIFNRENSQQVVGGVVVPVALAAGLTVLEEEAK